MAWNNGGSGPWGSGPGRPGPGPGGGQPPDFDEFINMGRARFRNMFGGRSRPPGNFPARSGLLVGLAAGIGVWVYASVFSVKPDEAAVVLTFGRYTTTQGPGLHFAAWPIQNAEILPVTRENSIEIGYAGGADREEQERGFRRFEASESLMLTGDENIVDINFQVVWNIASPEKFLFNLAEPDKTIKAVAESAMRQVIGRSELKPILNRDRAVVSQDVHNLIQNTLDSYQSGVNVVRVNFDRADPPPGVIDAFRDVQAAEQDRDTLEKRAGAYANQRLAEARGEAAQILQEAEGYRARVVKEAEGEAERFKEVYASYQQAPDVTRKRLYLETIEQVLGDVEKIVIDETGDGGQGVVPYLPLNELRRNTASEDDDT